MRKDEVERLLDRYNSARKENKETYFDADQVEEILNYFEEAIDYTLYEEILALGLKLHPGNTSLLLRKAKVMLNDEEYEDALALLQTISDPGNPDLETLTIECYCMLDNYGKVIEITEKLINDNVEYLDTIFEYITPILNDEEMFKEAMDYARRGLKLFPTNILLKEELCYTLETEGDFARAIQICNELIDHNPYSFDYWFTLGRLYSFEAQYEKAIEAFDFALDCDDSEVELKILKAFCLYMNESYEKAIEVYKDIPLEGPMVERIIPLIAECYIKLAEYEKAYRLLHDLINGDKPVTEVNTYIHLIHCCVMMERNEEAFDILQKAVIKFPENIRILALLAEAYMEKGEDNTAILITNKLLSLLDHPDEIEDEEENLLHAGQYLYIKGEIDKALEYLEKAYKLNPYLPFIHIHLALVYLSKGDMKNFSYHYKQSSPEEILSFIKKSGFELKKEDFKDILINKPVSLTELAKEYIKNKDNRN